MTKTTDDKTPRGNLAQLVLAPLEPFDLVTSSLGLIRFSGMTHNTENIFRLEVKDVYSIDDETLVREYLRAIAWISDYREKETYTLTTEQINQVTHEELTTFATVYLTDIEKKKNIIDPISEFAALIRAERTANDIQRKKLTEFANTAIRVSSLSEVMKNWPTFQKRGDVKVGEVTLQMTDTLGLNVVNRSEIARFLRQTDEESKHAHEKVETADIPVQRTADAVEQLVAGGQRLEQSIDLIVLQAGNVAQMFAQVVTTLEGAAATSQADTKKSLKWAVGTLIAAVVLSIAGLCADYYYSKSDGQVSDNIVKELQAQNKYLKSLLEEKNAREKAPMLIAVPQQKPKPEAQKPKPEAQKPIAPKK